jgi:hypothetical protein
VDALKSKQALLLSGEPVVHLVIDGVDGGDADD